MLLKSTVRSAGSDTSEFQIVGAACDLA